MRTRQPFRIEQVLPERIKPGRCPSLHHCVQDEFLPRAEGVMSDHPGETNHPSAKEFLRPDGGEFLRRKSRNRRDWWIDFVIWKLRSRSSKCVACAGGTSA